MSNSQTPASNPSVFEQIIEAQMRVLEAADHLTNEYTRHDKGHGTGVGMRASEDRLMTAVFWWRKVCGTGTDARGLTADGLRLLSETMKQKGKVAHV